MPTYDFTGDQPTVLTTVKNDIGSTLRAVPREPVTLKRPVVHPLLKPRAEAGADAQDTKKERKAPEAAQVPSGPDPKEA